MISMADLQGLFAKVEGTAMPVDLLKVGQSMGSANNGAVSKNKSNHKFRLALDIEDCLDRFYGGYYSDWACGGQWNRAYQFVQLLVNAFDVANIEVIVFFDGSLHDRRRGQLADAKETRQRTTAVLKHIRMIGTPPPKIWWLPPSGIRTCIRNALRSLSVQVVQTVNDHRRELIDFYREHKLSGIVGLHPDYIVAQPAHYYSSHDLRLSYKGTLETKEYLVAKLLAHLDVQRAQLPFVAAFLGNGLGGGGGGNGIADEAIVRSIYKAIGVEMTADFETRMRAVTKVVATAPTGNVAAFIKQLKLDEWSTTVREAIEYYQKRERLVKTSGKQHQQQQLQPQQAKNNKQKRGKVKAAGLTTVDTTPNAVGTTNKPEPADESSDNGVPAAETNSAGGDSVEAPLIVSAALTALASETTDQDDEFQRQLESDVNNLVGELDYDGEFTDMMENLTIKYAESKSSAEATSTTAPATSTASSTTAAAATPAPATSAEPKTTAAAVAAGNSSKQPKQPTAKAEKAFVYTLPSDVIKTAYNRHQRGMMDARLYQLLTKKEIVLTQALEDEQYRDVPSVHLFYRPARQMIYAILFNLNHQKYIHSKHPNINNKTTPSAAATMTTTSTTTTPQVPNNNTATANDTAINSIYSATAASTTITASNHTPTIAVNEWRWSPQNEYKRPETVYATQLGWAVPTIQRLWFGTLFEDKQRRMKAFLSVMRSDAPLMLNRDYVPQHMLAMACVLRYIVTHPERTILSRQELDAFLATAFSPHIGNIEYTQELVLPCVYLRGVYLGTLFMQGVETASMANDACGVPLPWTMCNPWLFFDGKLFHLKLKTATCVQSLRELCDDHIEIVLKIERFRKAILEDVEHFLLPPIIGNHSAGNNSNKSQYFNAGLSPMASNPYFSAAGPGGPHSINAMDRRRSVQQQLVRQLRQQRNHDDYHVKVGGVVLSSWSGDMSGRKPYNNGAGSSQQYSQRNHHHHHHQQQQQQQQQQQHQVQQHQVHQHQQHQQAALHSHPNYAPYIDNTYHQHHHQHQQRPRGNGLNASVFYNNIANRRRRSQTPYVNGIAGSGGGGGLVHRTIGRKSVGALGGSVSGGGVSAESKLAKNKARKQRARNNKVTTAAAASVTTPTTSSPPTTTTTISTAPSADTEIVVASDTLPTTSVTSAEPTPTQAVETMAAGTTPVVTATAPVVTSPSADV